MNNIKTREGICPITNQRHRISRMYVSDSFMETKGAEKIRHDRWKVSNIVDFTCDPSSECLAKCPIYNSFPGHIA